MHGEPILERDLLRAQVLLDGDRVVRAALDGRVVGDDHDLAARHAADAGDDAGRRRIVVVHVERGERGQLEKRRARIEQPLDALADRQLALLAMTLRTYFAPPPCRAVASALAQLSDEVPHPLRLFLKVSFGGSTCDSRTSITSRSSRS